MTPNNAHLIFERWKATLQAKDGKGRSYEHVSANFDELFDELQTAGITFAEAYAILPNAIKAHQPTAGAAKWTWEHVKRNPKFHGVTQKEWLSEWNDKIASTATNSFYIFFPVPKANEDDDGEPKVYNKMSAREYKLQRAHAEQFKRVDLKSLNDQNTEFLSEEELLELVRKNSDG